MMVGKYAFIIIISVTSILICLTQLPKFYQHMLFNQKNVPVIVPFNCSVRGDKWVVLTTIFYPTPALYKFLLLKGWNLIVIGDRKTPKDWLSRVKPSARARMIYLSIDEQMQLDFKIIRYLPEGSYARKNIGYLIAVFCGATTIYESDDDNLIDSDHIRSFPKQSTAAEIPWFTFHRERSSLINIYGVFGHPKIWPRGFSIEELRNVTEDGWSSLRRTQPNETVNAYIQQFLADLDPDVDALYRLGHPMTLGLIRFDRAQKPVALEPYTFSPYNTQNTITHYEAFWGLYLPVTTNFRVCDIWRGYWVQRLLWDIGGHLVFGSATVQQKRNAHSYIKDMDDEQQIYHQSGKLVRFLNSWHSTASTLVERILQLAEDMAINHFWDSHENDIIHAWLDDLVRVDYKFPSFPSKAILFKKQKVEKSRRTAVCVTGQIAVNKTWTQNEVEIRKRISGDIDIFMYISTSTTSSENQLAKYEVLRYNATIRLFYEKPVLDLSHFKELDKCTLIIDGESDRPQIYRHYQQLWAQAKCYQLVKEYEQKLGLRYQLFMRAELNGLLTKMPSTFDRPNTTFDMEQKIILMDDQPTHGVNDLFAIGPLQSMQSYMLRLYDFTRCEMLNMTSRAYLKHTLDLQKVPFITDKEIIYLNTE